MRAANGIQEEPFRSIPRAGHVASSRVGSAPPLPPPTTPRSASGAPAGVFRRHHRIRRAK
eukprot:5783988-Alexandrium_andersonii.AAC.1